MIYCLSQPYDARLVLLALVVCTVSSFATFSFYPRAIAEAAKRRSPLWISLASVTAASAVWATHFTAMMAFDPRVRIGYAVPETVGSFVVAGLATAAGLGIAVHFRGRYGIYVAGVILGLATAAMHYTGTSGMQLAGYLRWDIPTVTLSVLCSIVFAVAALVACGSGATWQRRAAGAALFAVSIATLHFIGMAAIQLVVAPGQSLPHNLLSGELLAAAVGAVSLIVVGSTMVAWLIDRRAQREGDVRVRFMARHDLLTSLPNRLLFSEIAQRELTETAAAQRTAAILCLDLDGFKEVNDIFGHAAGDAVLKEVARRLQALLGERCVAARLGGDEFAVLATGLGRTKTAASAAQSVLETLSTPYEVDGSMMDIGCSIGVAMFPADATDYAMLLTRADVALSRAKTEGRGVFRFFEAAMDEAMRERRRFGRDLRAALGTGQISVVYQPQYDLSRSAVSGFEVLARWQHPERGVIPPADFIPVAEETGTILALGEWVLREACREASGWTQPLTIAVNVSAAQFRQANLLKTVQKILRETGLPPSRLELEVTESLFFEPTSRTLQVLTRFKELGIRIAMDDFGTGFSSLRTLQSFAFDKIKIDRSFTAQIDADPKGAAIVKAIIRLSAALDTPVIAEGVETQSQIDFLRREHCDAAQGYLLGQPLPIADYAALVGSPARARRVA